MSDPIELFKQAITAAGLTPPDTVEADGKIHRFASDGRKGKEAGWYVLHLDGMAAGEFGCWRTGMQSTWCSKSNDTITPEERREYRERMAAIAKEREVETKAKQQEAATECLRMWDAAKECPVGGHPYITRKGIKPIGVKLLRDALLIPLRMGKELVSLQFIGADGGKRFKTGGQVTGAYCAIGKPSGTVVVCEGYATGASIYEATGYAVAVAFNAGNLQAVAQAMRGKLPTAKLVIAADDDYQSESNTGLAKATAASQAVSGYLAVPDFGAGRPDGATDFNDLHQITGLEAVKRCIDGSTLATLATDTNAPAGQEQGGAVDADEWLSPEPLAQSLPTVPAFNFDLLPAALRGWVLDIATRMQCPPDFVAVGAVVALSSLIGAKVQIHPKERDDWRVTPNLWGMVIGRPGVMKSPALSEVLKPLHRLEATSREAWQEEHAHWQTLQQVGELERANREKAAKAAAGKKSRADVAKMLQGEALECEPVQRRMIVNDCSVEALTELLRGNEWGLLAFRDELAGLIESMGREGQEGARAFYLSAFDGDKSHTVDRIGRGMGLVIPRVCVAMLGGIQPSKLQSIVREATQGGGSDDGLLQRFQLAVWPDVTADWVNVDRYPDTACRQTANELFDRLAALPDPEGEAPAWKFTTEAQAVFTEWRTEFERRIRDEDLHPAMASHLAKYRKLIPALALIFALVDTPQDCGTGQAGKIGETELLRALAWGEYLERHAQRIYAAATMPETGAALVLLKRIRAGDVGEAFTPREIAQKCWGQLASTEAVKQAGKVLEECHWVRRETIRAGTKGGRPSELFRVSPYAKDADLKLVE